jgi:hypothetical protein
MLCADFCHFPVLISWDGSQQKEKKQLRICFLCLEVGLGREVSWGSCGMCHSCVIDDLDLAAGGKINSKTQKTKKREEDIIIKIEVL